MFLNETKHNFHSFFGLTMEKDNWYLDIITDSGGQVTVDRWQWMGDSGQLTMDRWQWMTVGRWHWHFHHYDSASVSYSIDCDKDV